MTSVPPERARTRQRSASEIREALRELRIQLSLLNYRVGSQMELKDVDLDCLDIIEAYGPLSPSALARRAGLSRMRLDEVFLRVVVTVPLVSRLDCCSSCRTTTTAYWLV